MSRTCVVPSSSCHYQIWVRAGGNYVIRLNPTQTPIPIPYYLTVNSFTGTTYSTNMPTTQLLKIVDSRIGSFFDRYFYVSNGTYNVTAAYLTRPRAESDIRTLINIYSTGTISGPYADVPPLTTPLIVGMKQINTYRLPKGLYILFVLPPANENSLFLTWPG